MPTSPDPYAAQRRATDQALGGMACWGDDLPTYKIAQPVGPARWQVLVGVLVCVAAVVWWKGWV